MEAHIKIDDELMHEAMRATGLEEAGEVVQAALRLVVQLRAQESFRELRGQVEWEGDLDESRLGRFWEGDEWSSSTPASGSTT
jgi:Arc/MetJ family transcription regulator